MSYMSPGSLIGEMSALYGITRQYSAVAATDTDVLVFSAEDFLNFLEMYPDIRGTLEQLCVRHYQETMGRGMKMGSPIEMIMTNTKPSETNLDVKNNAITEGKGGKDKDKDKDKSNKDKEKGKEKKPETKAPPLVKNIPGDGENVVRQATDEKGGKGDQKLSHQPFNILDPLRVPLRRGQLKDKEKEILLQDTSSSKKWWHVFITYGRVPKTEMGALLHIFQDEKHCSCWKFTIHPSSPMVRSSNWSVFNLLVVAISCSLTSYEISFTSNKAAENWLIAGLRYSAEIFFVVRIIGNFHLGYYDDTGTLITDCSVISRRYLTRFDGFILDLLTTLPFYTISYAVESESAAILAANIRGIQLLRVVLFVRYLNESETDLRMKASEVKILKITILLCFIFHFCACAWYLVACYGMVCSEGSWMDILLRRLIEMKQIKTIEDITIGSRYFISLAYVTTTIVACGFSDVTPRLPIELGATILFIFATVFVIGFLLGKMTQCLASQISRKIHYEHELSVIESHLVALGLNKSKREVVSEYYKLVWRRFRGMPYYGLLREFPYPLRADIAFEIYGPNLKNSRVLGKIDELILRQITARVQHEFYLPGSHIVQGGNVCDAVYFIKRGEILIIDENMGIELCVETLYENDCFGEIKILLPREPFRFSYVARLETEVGMLRREDLDEVLRNFPALKAELINKARRIKSRRADIKPQGEIPFDPPSLTIVEREDRQQQQQQMQQPKKLRNSNENPDQNLRPNIEQQQQQLPPKTPVNQAMNSKLEAPTAIAPRAGPGIAGQKEVYPPPVKRDAGGKDGQKPAGAGVGPSGNIPKGK